MRYVPLRSPEGSQFNSRAVITTVIAQSPNQALTLGDMRMRAKLLDKLEAVAPEGDSLLLEDAEWEVLRGCASKFPWSVFHRDLLRVLEDIDGAGAPQIVDGQGVRGEVAPETASPPLPRPNGRQPSRAAAR